MSELTIYRGTHQIGGCCTELCVNGQRILIDLGANLPGSDETAPIKDADLLDTVLDGRPVHGVLFTHYHGDHCALYPKLAAKLPGTPMYIGPLAQQILMLVAAYTNRESIPIVKDMRTYEAGTPLADFPGLSILPLYVDHSALDAYMFYIEAAGKKILFTGDFRDHGVQGKQLWKMLHSVIVPKGVDILITEGTMLSRERVSGQEGAALTEAALGKRAAALLQKHKYNFVLVSSTNTDSIMEFYHNTPAGMPFVCDFYQARMIVTAMEGMGRRKGRWEKYQTAPSHPTLRVLDPGHEKWENVRRRARAMYPPLDIKPITEEELERDGFILLARKNSHPKDYTSRFEELRDTYFDRDGQIIYSMWEDYLKPKYADKALIDFIGGRPVEHLHTSGHAYVETIAKLIETVDPKVIIPMHTERADEFAAIPEFALRKGRVQVLNDGQVFSLDTMSVLTKEED